METSSHSFRKKASALVVLGNGTSICSVSHGKKLTEKKDPSHPTKIVEGRDNVSSSAAADQEE